MRQVGVIAAAGIIALRTEIERMEEDHANARRLAEGLREIPGIVLETERPKTNMVYFRVAPTSKVKPPVLFEEMKKRGILADLRLVTHRWITSGDVDNVVRAFREVITS